MDSGDDSREGDEALPAPSSEGSIVERVLTLPTRLSGVVSSLLVLVMLALVSYSIVQRYILNTPLKWGDELLGYLLVGFVFLGAAEALRRGEHISIDLISDRLSGWPRKIASILYELAVITFAFVVGISAWEAIGFTYNFGSYSEGYLEMPMWIPQLPILVGSFLLGLVGFIRLARLVARK